MITERSGRLPGLLLALAGLCFAEQGIAEMCEAQSPSAQGLAVRNAPGGRLLGYLPNGKHVFYRYEEWRESGPAILVAAHFKGQWRDLGYVDEAEIDCRRSSEAGAFPLVFASGQELRELGIVLAGLQQGQTPPLENACFYYGDGGYGLSLSDAFLAPYRELGFQDDVVCTVLRAGGLRFDPETGERLPTYMIADLEALQGPAGQYPEPGMVTEELPLTVPECFRTLQGVQKVELGVELGWGCAVRFDPWSGIALTAEEQAHYQQHIRVSISGEAGPSASAADVKLALSGKKRATKASVQSVMDLLKR